MIDIRTMCRRTVDGSESRYPDRARKVIDIKSESNAMNYVISISTDAILAQVLAQAAMRNRLSATRPAVLTTDHGEALRALARGAFSRVCLVMAPVMSDCNVDAEDCTEGMMRMEIDDHGLLTLHPMALRAVIEHAIAVHVLSEAYAGTDAEASEVFARDFEESMSLLRRSMREPFRGARIRAWRV